MHLNGHFHHTPGSSLFQKSPQKTVFIATTDQPSLTHSSFTTRQHHILITPKPDRLLHLGPTGAFSTSPRPHFPAPFRGGPHSSGSATGHCGVHKGQERPGQARPGRGHAASMAALDRGALGHTPSPGSPALLCAHPDLSNPVSEPKSVGSQRGGSFLTGKHSLRDRASQPPHYPKRCPFVLHHPCFPLSADPFSLAPQAAHHAEARF